MILDYDKLRITTNDSHKSQIITRITELKIQSQAAITEAQRQCEIAVECSMEIMRLEEEMKGE